MLPKFTYLSNRAELAKPLPTLSDWVSVRTERESKSLLNPQIYSHTFPSTSSSLSTYAQHIR